MAPSGHPWSLVLHCFCPIRYVVDPLFALQTLPKKSMAVTIAAPLSYQYTFFLVVPHIGSVDYSAKTNHRSHLCLYSAEHMKPCAVKSVPTCHEMLLWLVQVFRLEIQRCLCRSSVPHLQFRCQINILPQICKPTFLDMEMPSNAKDAMLETDLRNKSEHKHVI